MLHGAHVVGCTARARVSGPSAPLESCARHIPTHGMALGHCGDGTVPLWAWHSYLPAGIADTGTGLAPTGDAVHCLGVKVLAWYRPDAAPAVCKAQQDFVQRIGEECR